MVIMGFTPSAWQKKPQMNIKEKKLAVGMMVQKVSSPKRTLASADSGSEDGSSRWFCYRDHKHYISNGPNFLGAKVAYPLSL